MANRYDLSINIYNVSPTILVEIRNAVLDAVPADTDISFSPTALCETEKGDD